MTSDELSRAADEYAEKGLELRDRDLVEVAEAIIAELRRRDTEGTT